VKPTTARGASLLLAAALAIALVVPVAADQPTDTSSLRAAVSPEGITTHLQAFQSIASANGGTRAAGTAGYDASAAYVEDLLLDAGYSVSRQPFSYDVVVVDEALMDPSPAVAGESDPFTYGEDFLEMSFSPGGSVDALVQAVDVNLTGDRASSSGCEAIDFATFTPGNIALLQRGTCPFRQKAETASAAGASAVIIFNQGNIPADPSDDRLGLFGGTLDPDPNVSGPVFSMPFDLGAKLVELDVAGDIRLHIELETHDETINTFNVIADSPAGRTDRTVVVGAHLDSVREGPGINDNGSGSATILEIALQMAALEVEPTNRVRFAFWGGEEDGLIGSDFYVSRLSARDIKNHALNLNFDMVGSPNFVRFVYDGDGSAFGIKGPNGSSHVEAVFNDYFASIGLPTEPTAFDGRSDYFGFITAGIPAGGLFSGAEGLKTPDQAMVYGGMEGEQYDPCYHEACDTIGNVDQTALDQMSDAAAHSVLTFAMTSSAVNGTAKGNATASGSMAFHGSKATR
jgi:Zn-dependent M28 family amino/carboxypeptidase